MVLVGVLGGTSVSAQEKSTSESIRTATIQLFKAVENHDVEAAQAALDNGADVSGVLEKSHSSSRLSTVPVTPLELALCQSDMGAETVDPMVEVLVTAGADVNFSPERDRPALRDGGTPPLKCAQDQIAHLSYLLERGANPNQTWASGPPLQMATEEGTHLHWAAACCPEVARMFLRYGANPEAVLSGHGGDTQFERTPVYYAVHAHSGREVDGLEIAKALFEYGHSPWGAVDEKRAPMMTGGMMQTVTSVRELVEDEKDGEALKEWLGLLKRARRKNLDYKAPDIALLARGVTASSTLTDDEDPYRYSAANAFDGNPETAWVENVDGGGGAENPDALNVDSNAGEWVEITFNQPVALTAVEVKPGYFKGEYWKLNNRVREIVVWRKTDSRGALSAGGSAFLERHEFDDARQPQRIEFDHITEAKSLRFEIRSVYEGERWDDTPISEIALYRNGERIELQGNLADADSPVVISEEEWK